MHDKLGVRAQCQSLRLHSRWHQRVSEDRRTAARGGVRAFPRRPLLVDRSDRLFECVDLADERTKRDAYAIGDHELAVLVVMRIDNLMVLFDPLDRQRQLKAPGLRRRMSRFLAEFGHACRGGGGALSRWKLQLWYVSRYLGYCKSRLPMPRQLTNQGHARR